MLNAEVSIVDEVETAINIGSAEKRLETIKRFTDLFLSSAGNFNSEQIELFDDVLERLVKTIEIRAIADVSARIESRSRKFGQDDKWNFCLTAAIIAVNRRNHE